MTTLSKSGDPVVDAALKPLAGVFRPGATDIVANKPREVWIEIAGKGWKKETVPELDSNGWRNINKVLANWTGASYDAVNSPTVSCRLPGGHRYEGMIGRGPADGVSVAIRVARKERFTVEDFGLAGGDAARVKEIVRTGGNFIVSGGTGSGKTSFFRAVSRSVPSDQRILTLEDPPELDLDRFPNHNVFTPARHGGGLPQSAFLDHFMRSRPDRVWLGELSMKNGFAAMMAMNTGHKGFGLTLHSNGALEALDSAFADRLVMNEDSKGSGPDPLRLSTVLRRTIDLVVQIEKRPEGRRVVELWEPQRESEPRRLLPVLIGGH